MNRVNRAPRGVNAAQRVFSDRAILHRHAARDDRGHALHRNVDPPRAAQTHGFVGAVTWLRGWFERVDNGFGNDDFAVWCTTEEVKPERLRFFVPLGLNQQRLAGIVFKFEVFIRRVNGGFKANGVVVRHAVRVLVTLGDRQAARVRGAKQRRADLTNSAAVFLLQCPADDDEALDKTGGFVDVPDRSVEIQLCTLGDVIVVKLARADDDVAHAKLGRAFEAAESFAVQRRDARLDPVADVALRSLDLERNRG